MSWLLVPLLGVMLSIGMLAAIVSALTPDARWDARHNPGQPPRQTRWGPVLGAVLALMIGGIVLMGTIAFAGQRFFEWQMQAGAGRHAQNRLRPDPVGHRGDEGRCRDREDPGPDDVARHAPAHRRRRAAPSRRRRWRR